MIALVAARSSPGPHLARLQGARPGRHANTGRGREGGARGRGDRREPAVLRRCRSRGPHRRRLRRGRLRRDPSSTTRSRSRRWSERARRCPRRCFPPCAAYGAPAATGCSSPVSVETTPTPPGSPSWRCAPPAHHARTRRSSVPCAGCSRSRLPGAGWAGAAGTSTVSNSTGLALRGLTAAGDGWPAGAAAALRALQGADGGFDAAQGAPGSRELATLDSAPALLGATLPLARRTAPGQILRVAILCAAGRAAAGAPATGGSRKVRTPKGRVLGNSQAEKSDGQCNRKDTAQATRKGRRQG